MKIALVCSEVVKGSGHGRYMLELATRLCGTHDVHVYSDACDPIPGVTHHRVKAPAGIKLLRVFGFWLGASLALRGKPFDIIHTIGGCCLWRNVVTAQFCQRAWGLERRLHPEAHATGTPWWRGLYHDLYWRLCDWLEAPAFQSARTRALIAVSQRVANELTTHYGASVTAVIYNGVAPEEFEIGTLSPLRSATRAEWAITEDHHVWLFVGDFYRKGLAIAIQALAQVPDDRTLLLVVGAGDQAAFDALAQHHGVRDRVVFTGFQRQVQGLFAAADGFIFPTLYEPFGMVITEAMAAGLPVITTRAAGAAELIVHRVNGLVIEDPEDTAAFALAITEVQTNPEWARQLGQLARETARRVDWDSTCEATLAVYKQVTATV